MKLLNLLAEVKISADLINRDDSIDGIRTDGTWTLRVVLAVYSYKEPNSQFVI